MEIIWFCLLSYLLGSISFAMLIGRWFFRKNLREEGSGNLGATNTFRVLGKKAGFVVLFADIAKGFVPALFPLWFGLDVHPITLGIFAIVGHVFPVFFGFKGGKAVATTSGVILAYSPILFVILFFVFLLFLYLTKIVSLSSVLMSITLAAYSLWSGDMTFIIFSLFIWVFITYTHRENIKRIRLGTEPKITWL